MLVPTTGCVVHAAAAVSVSSAPSTLRYASGTARPGTSRVSGDRVVWVEQMLLHPQAAVAKLLGLFAESAQSVASDVATELRQRQTDVHRRLHRIDLRTH